MNAHITHPFCQIEDKNITLMHCVQLQKAEDKKRCFGCASPQRHCVRCDNKPVAFPEVDLCPNCLMLELNKPTSDRIPPGAVTCQCGQHPIYYDAYKLCLQCTIDRYQPGASEVNGAENGAPAKRRRRRRRRGESDEALYQEALTLTTTRGEFTCKMLINELHINSQRASELASQLEKNGVIGPSRGCKPRRVLPQPKIKPSGSPPNSQPIDERSLSLINKSAGQGGALSARQRELVRLALHSLQDEIQNMIDQIE